MATVLIADDAKFMRMMLRKILEESGMEVAGEAGNGREAFSRYLELRPDVVTMDITMPDIDGLEAARLIRNIDPQAKIIMVSAMGQQQLIVEALQAGAMDFIVKPFEPMKVVETIKRVLGQVRAAEITGGTAKK